MANPPYNILYELMGRVQELSNAVAPNQRNTNPVSNSASALASTSNQAQISTSTVEALWKQRYLELSIVNHLRPVQLLI